MRTSSMPASTRLAVPASAASTTMWTVWPAYADRSWVAVRHVPARSDAAPLSFSTVLDPSGPTTRTRRWSAVELLLRWAKNQEKRSDGAPRSEEHTSELQSRENLVCRLL